MALGHNDLWCVVAEDDIEAEDDIGTVDDVGDPKAWIVYRSVVEVVDSKLWVLDSMAGADKMVLAMGSTLSGLVDVL